MAGIMLRGASLARGISVIPRRFSNWTSKTKMAAAPAWSPTKPGSSRPPAIHIRANNEYDGEEYDARLEVPGWSRAGFGDTGWESAQSVPAPGGILAAQMAEPLRVTETLHPAGMKQHKPGDYIFDMGQNMVGWCRLKVAGPKGAQVKLRHAETLNPDGSLYTANLRSAAATDLYTLKGSGTVLPDCAGKSPRARPAGQEPCPAEEHGDLGAALYLSRLPLRGGHRLSRVCQACGWQIEGRCGSRRHGEDRRLPRQLQLGYPQLRFTTTCFGASAAIIAAFLPTAHSAMSARAGWATAPR